MLVRQNGGRCVRVAAVVFFQNLVLRFCKSPPLLRVLGSYTDEATVVSPKSKKLPNLNPLGSSGKKGSNPKRVSHPRTNKKDLKQNKTKQCKKTKRDGCWVVKEG